MAVLSHNVIWLLDDYVMLFLLGGEEKVGKELLLPCCGLQAGQTDHRILVNSGSILCTVNSLENCEKQRGCGNSVIMTPYSILENSLTWILNVGKTQFDGCSTFASPACG